MKKVCYLLMCIIAFSSCGGLFQDSFGDSLKGWYADVSNVPTEYDFGRINQAIRNNECIYTTGYSHNYDRYATRDLFFDSSGRWQSSAAHYGTCRFLPGGEQLVAYNFINENTLVVHYAWLWDPDYLSSNAEIAGKTYAGSIFGELVFYDESPRTYTYSRVDNKVFVSNGDIFTVTDSGLIKDGSSKILTKYNPSISF